MTHGGASTEASPSRDSDAREITALDLAAILVGHWRLVLGAPLAIAALAAGLSFVMPPRFTATTTFVPEAPAGTRLPTGLAGIAGLAGQLGLSLGADASRSPRFYAEVLKSRELLERVLVSRYPDPRAFNPGDSSTLLAILEIQGRNAKDSLASGVRRLSDLVSARVDNQTGIVQLSVSCRWPNLAAGITNRLIVYLNDFNTQTRQSQARERRKFVEQRITAAEEELRTVEEGLRSFYERNRSWQQSPQLTFEEGRLRRQVDIRQEVYLTLKREYETSRIEEVNDTPVITVIDPAVSPQRRSRPMRTLMTSLGFLLGAILAVFGAFGIEFIDRVRRKDGDAYRDFASVLERARREVGYAIRAVLTRRSGR